MVAVNEHYVWDELLFVWQCRRRNAHIHTTKRNEKAAQNHKISETLYFELKQKRFDVAHSSTATISLWINLPADVVHCCWMSAMDLCAANIQTQICTMQQPNRQLMRPTLNSVILRRWRCTNPNRWDIVWMLRSFHVVHSSCLLIINRGMWKYECEMDFNKNNKRISETQTNNIALRHMKADQWGGWCHSSQTSGTECELILQHAM